MRCDDMPPKRLWLEDFVFVGVPLHRRNPIINRVMDISISISSSLCFDHVHKNRNMVAVAVPVVGYGLQFADLEHPAKLDLSSQEWESGVFWSAKRVVKHGETGILLMRPADTNLTKRMLDPINFKFVVGHAKHR